MHGRQKIQRSAEEEEKKQKERAKTLEIYKQSMKFTFSKRQKGELDIELMKVTSQLLTKNPDICVLWNIRKEWLLKEKANDYETFRSYVNKELDLTEACLRVNPKSYHTWHQRTWLMQETNFELVDEEIKLCSNFLKLDDRNFHCWDYRKFLVKNSKTVTLQQELDFTTDKIVSNFSNYSSWHLRSTILPCLSSSSDYLMPELDLIKNAAFTDPNDQSVWFYHRWLLNSQLPKGESDPETQPKSKEFEKLLQDELKWVTELHELEPDNKWTISTLILLMRMINFVEYKTQILEFLEKLIELDPNRLNYYLHLRSKYLME